MTTDTHTKALSPGDNARAHADRVCAAAEVQPSSTAGMNIAQRILHVGGRGNAAGYIEFGSIQAVQSLVRHVLRDQQQPVAVPQGWKLVPEVPTDAMVLAAFSSIPSEDADPDDPGTLAAWERMLAAAPAAPAPGALGPNFAINRTATDEH